jgi:hypothetical protein
MPPLYVRPDGTGCYEHSYSAGIDYDKSPLGYYKRRIEGWREADNRAAFRFGRAIEDSIEFYHNNGRDLVSHFVAIWNLHKDIELKYTKLEKDWANLLRCGVEMLQLYIIRQPSLPIPMGAKSAFQRKYEIEMYPNDPWYGEILHVGKVDVVAYTEPDHPLLPAIDWTGKGNIRESIGDIKTTASVWAGNGLVRFHPQMRNYAFLTKIYTVWMLWFVKKCHKVGKGNIVTLLANHGNVPAGEELIVASLIKDSEEVYLVPDKSWIETMEKEQGRKEDGSLDTKKEANERKEQWLVKYAIKVPLSAVTKQRLIFDSGIITPESAMEAGEIAGRQIQQIVNSWKTNKWPSTYQVSYPRDDSKDPYFRAFILNDTEFRDANFTRTFEEAFDDLEPEPEGVED